MRAITTILLFAALAGCAAPPDPVIVTKEVKVAVPTPCKPEIARRPMLQTKDVIAKALAAAPTFDDRLKIVTEQLLLYIGWTPIVEAALEGCRGAPSPKNNDGN